MLCAREADASGLAAHGAVREARDECGELIEKKALMERLIAFLRDDSIALDTPMPTLLDDAERLTLEPALVSEVRALYESVAPKLEARNALRHAVEACHRPAILDAREKVRLMSYHAMSCDAMSYHGMSCHVMQYRVSCRVQE